MRKASPHIFAIPGAQDIPNYAGYSVHKWLRFILHLCK